MRKRLRKKLHRGEFRELGFEVYFRCAADIADDAFDDLVGGFIREAIEALGLMCGGGGKRPEWEVFVTADRRGSATEEHCRAVERWLSARHEVEEFRVGALVDAWNPG